VFQHLSGLEEAVYRNIAACKQFADTVKTAYGPNGMNKIIINHIDKTFITNDAATIVKELDVSVTFFFQFLIFEYVIQLISR
jgi:T-complex protein 1 subunit theta